MKTYATLVVLALTLGACGGGGGGGPQPVAVDLPLVVERSGTVQAAGGVSTVDVGFGAKAGDGINDQGEQGFLAYGLGALPGGARIVEARLLLTVEADEGSGFDLGSLGLDHTDLGAGLDAADYLPQLLRAPDRIVTDAPGPISLDVTDLVAADVADHRVRTEFRLRFLIESNHDGEQDTIYVPAADPTRPAADQATLRVIFEP